MPSLSDLLALAHALGAPAADAAILGEGNISARHDAATFHVKGSGCALGTMTAGDFVHVRFAELLPLLDDPGVDLARVGAAYAAAKVDPAQPRRPSVETVLHAALLNYPEVAVVAHTHPTAVNSLTCSPRWRELLAGRLFPDEAVVLGRDSVFIDYEDPGVVLARAIRSGVDAYVARHGELPKAIYMQNHGFIALAATHTEAGNITAMAIKAARIRLGALAAGGLNLLPAAVIDHLVARPDEQFRARSLTSR